MKTNTRQLEGGVIEILEGDNFQARLAQAEANLADTPIGEKINYDIDKGVILEGEHPHLYSPAVEIVNQQITDNLDAFETESLSPCCGASVADGICMDCQLEAHRNCEGKHKCIDCHSGEVEAAMDLDARVIDLAFRAGRYAEKVESYVRDVQQVKKDMEATGI